MLKTDYYFEIVEFLSTNFAPVSTPATEHTKLSLPDIHNLVTAVLPSKWVNEAQVHAALVELQFKTFPFKEDNKTVFLYYLQDLNN